MAGAAADLTSWETPLDKIMHEDERKLSLSEVYIVWAGKTPNLSLSEEVNGTTVVGFNLLYANYALYWGRTPN